MLGTFPLNRQLKPRRVSLFLVPRTWDTRESGILCRIHGGRTGMPSLTSGKHAGSGAVSNQTAVAEPTFAERARTLVYLGRVGSLSTLSRKQQGFPFGSVMPYGLDDHANPIFLISTMAMHTQNVQADPRSSLLVTQPDTIAARKYSPGTCAGSSRSTETLPGALCQQQILGGL